MKTKLHEILAIDGIKEGLFKSTIPEMVTLFGMHKFESFCNGIN